jgi:hypothetical protein
MVVSSFLAGEVGCFLISCKTTVNPVFTSPDNFCLLNMNKGAVARDSLLPFHPVYDSESRFYLFFLFKTFASFSGEGEDAKILQQMLRK